MIYFDNSATTKIAPGALQTYQAVSEQFYGNPSSLHVVGEKAFHLLEQSRQQIADLLNVQSDEIYFTSGGTEGDNWALKGTAIEKSAFGKHLITTSVEHPTIIKSMQQLEKLGFEVTYLPVDKFGRINPADLKAAIRSDTILVSIMAVNNEIGTCQPLMAAAEILKDYPNIHFHVDAVQGIGKGIQKEIFNDRVDFVTLSGHKFHGPRGTGILYKKRDRHLAPLLTGGGQEHDLRSGTENVPAIAAMAKALRLLLTDEAQKVQKQAAIRERIYQHVSQAEKTVMFSQLTPDFVPHILCFAIKGVRGETTVHAFEEHEIYISTTSACSSKKGMESSTLKAMHVNEKIATSAIRISLDEYNTLAEADEFIKAFDQINHRFKKINS
ncbi:cysteine desulfurase family protein [Latilactobacillus sakei]